MSTWRLFMEARKQVSQDPVELNALALNVACTRTRHSQFELNAQPSASRALHGLDHQECPIKSSLPPISGAHDAGSCTKQARKLKKVDALGSRPRGCRQRQDLQGQPALIQFLALRVGMAASRRMFHVIQTSFDGIALPERRACLITNFYENQQITVFCAPGKTRLARVINDYAQEEHAGVKASRPFD